MRVTISIILDWSQIDAGSLIQAERNKKALRRMQEKKTRERSTLDRSQSNNISCNNLLNIKQLLNILLARYTNVYRLRSCRRKTFWAHAVIMMNVTWHVWLWETIIADWVCRYSVNHFWAGTCTTQYEFIVVNGQTMTSAFHEVV